jgi:hypothetical protein
MQVAARRWLWGLMMILDLAAEGRVPIAFAQEAATDPRPPRPARRARDPSNGSSIEARP